MTSSTEWQRWCDEDEGEGLWVAKSTEECREPHKGSGSERSRQDRVYQEQCLKGGCRWSGVVHGGYVLSSYPYHVSLNFFPTQLLERDPHKCTFINTFCSETPLDAQHHFSPIFYSQYFSTFPSVTWSYQHPIARAYNSHARWFWAAPGQEKPTELVGHESDVAKWNLKTG
ncbi:hypothetical protein BJV74DRAFT_797916 [Russula compacta]|nr:hypothetical protein BJV74DRAFT_797916 [Russula compacta]